MAIQPEESNTPRFLDRLHPEAARTLLGVLATYFIVDTAYTTMYDLGPYPITRAVAKAVTDFILY